MGKRVSKERSLSSTVLLLGVIFLLLVTIFGVLFQLYTLSGGRDIYFSPEQPELSLPSSDSAVGTVSLTIVDPDTLEGEEHES